MSKLIDKITDMQKVTMGPNDVMVIRVDIGNMPQSYAHSYMEGIKESFELLLLSKKIIVVPSTVSVGVIGQELLANAGH